MVASGGGLSFQWQKNGVDISGATSATLSLTDLQLTDAGNYRCVVTNSAGNVTSNEAILGVRLPNTLGEFTNGLVAFYPFDGNASDMSGNGHHGEMKGGAFAEDRHGNPSACKEGGAIVLPQSLAGQFGGDAPITVSVWAQHAAAPRNQALFGIGSNRIRRSFGLYSEEGKLCFSRWEDRFPTDYIFPEGQWAHCLVTHEGTTLKIYVNGKEVLSNEIQVDRLIGEAVLGASPFSAWRDSFRGSLDDVRIYNRALPPEEVKQLYEFEKLRK